MELSGSAPSLSPRWVRTDQPVKAEPLSQSDTYWFQSAASSCLSLKVRNNSSVWSRNRFSEPQKEQNRTFLCYLSAGGDNAAKRTKKNSTLLKFPRKLSDKPQVVGGFYKKAARKTMCPCVCVSVCVVVWVCGCVCICVSSSRSFMPQFNTHEAESSAEEQKPSSLIRFSRSKVRFCYHNKLFG